MERYFNNLQGFLLQKTGCVLVECNISEILPDFIFSPLFFFVALPACSGYSLLIQNLCNLWF